MFVIHHFISNQSIKVTVPNNAYVNLLQTLVFILLEFLVFFTITRWLRKQVSSILWVIHNNKDVYESAHDCSLKYTKNTCSGNEKQGKLSNMLYYFSAPAILVKLIMLYFRSLKCIPILMFLYSTPPDVK